jgi:tetratricopeptide (TPR) repeat protein
MQFDVKSKKEFIQLYRQKYRVDNSVIDEFEHHYDMHTPIWWYTQHACLSDMINQAFRLQDINISIKAGFLIQDLHKQIEKLYRPPSEKLTLYRGQRLTYAHFEELRMMQDGLFSFNSFLSTSIDQNVALYHADCSRHDSDRIGVVFVIKIDPVAVIFTPFCSLDNENDNSDLKREFLFTMFTVFRIGKMTQLEDRLWQVELSLTSDNDHDVKQLTNYIHQTTQGSTGWDRLGKLLLKMGHFDKAENVFQTLIANSAKNDFKELGHRYHQMGLVKKNTGLYKKAIIFYNKAIKMYQTCPDSNYSDFSTIHNDIGSLYQYTEEYTKALKSYQIAVDIEKESNPVNYSNLAIIYDNIAEVNKNMKQYSTALQFYKIILKIHRTCIPLNFQKVSTAYRKIAEMHFHMEEYPEALRLFQKIFHIQQYSLPPNYIDTATIENNIGQVYERMGEHSKASEQYRNAFKCYQPVLDVLPESHTQNVADLAVICNNIAAIHMNMKDFGKALEFYKKTLEILKKFPHVKKPDLAATYDNIGQVYQNMNDYSNAFLLYSKATRVARESSPVNPSQVRLYKTHLEVARDKIGPYPRMVISKEIRELIDMI